jgi:hypothetical protein
MRTTKVSINEDPSRLVKALRTAARAEGLETAVDLGLNLIHYRWLYAETPGAWAEFTDALRKGMHQFASEHFVGSPSLRRVSPGVLEASTRAFANVAADHPQDEELRVFLHRAFEEMLILRETQLGRASGESASRPEIAKLLGEVCGSGPRLLDPTCGIGSSLLRSARAHSRQSVEGFDISVFAATTAEARFELAGICAQITTRDWLAEDSAGKWDSVCFEPPFSLELNRTQLEMNPEVGPRSDMVWLYRATRALSPGGFAAVVVPARTLSSPSDERHRTDLLDLDLVEAIISLPRNASLGTSIETCIWILRGTSDAVKTKKVLLINAESLFLGDESVQSAGLAQIIDLVLHWREKSELAPTDEWRAGVLSHDALKTKGSLLPSAHLGRPPLVTEPRPRSSGRGLTELRLAGFKAVDKELIAQLKPLTLVFGRNSAGKSSLIQSLLLLRASLHGPKLITQGEGFDLGSYRGLVNRHDTSRAMGFGVAFASAPHLDSSVEIPNPGLLRSLDVQFEQTPGGVPLTRKVRIGLGENFFEVRRDNFLVDEPFQLRINAAVEIVQLVNSEHFTFPSRKSSPQAHVRVQLALKRLGLEYFGIPANGSVPGSRHLIDFSPVESEYRKGLERAALARAIGLLTSVADELQALLDRAVYLGPLRRAPQRISSRQDSKATATDIPFFLLDNISERSLISGWMRRLEIPYDLDVLSFASAPGAHVLGDIASVVLTNANLGTTLSTADVGFGVSQVLPILVELSARRDTTILIEQPEIHLHPAMQSRLADIMIESIDEAGRGNQIIAETHSEHIMLRVQRRIREGTLDPDLVSVVYVDQDESGSASAQQLRIDMNGEFIDHWPHGFFAERFDEIFSGLL